jgi:hypothetical protein
MQQPREPALVGRDPNWWRVVDRMLGVNRKNDS